MFCARGQNELWKNSHCAWNPVGISKFIKQVACGTRLAWLLTEVPIFNMNGTRTPLIKSAGESASSPSSGYRPRVLVVDDETAIADTIATILSLNGYIATAEYDGDCALETALLKPPHLLITDVMLPGMNGVELAITMKRIYPECKILLFSGQASIADLMTSARRAGHHFTLLNKPLPPEDLLAEVAFHLQAGKGLHNTATI